jgi:hypothetical protein
VQIRRSRKLALLGFAAVGVVLAVRRIRNGEATRARSGLPGVRLDDDTAADIIRRALPSLERARQLVIAGHA